MADGKQATAAPADPPLLLMGAKFPLDLVGGELTIHSTPLIVEEEYNSGKGTGLNVWDGSIVLAKHLEHRWARGMVGKYVLELGSGPGVVGIAAGILGARRVVLTDLEYALGNLRKSIERNKASIKGDAIAAELDWTRPVPPSGPPLDLILASDVVWLDELVQPLVNTLKALTDEDATTGRRADLSGELALDGVGPLILLSHQVRSRAVDSRFFGALEAAGFVYRPIPESTMHPRFKDSAISIYEVRRQAAAAADL